jgi:hypothetical protein
MAYRAENARAAQASQAGDSDQARFGPLEIQVIRLAEADPVASIGAPSRFAAFFERWLGIERPKPLADSRLEALRRFAVLARVTGGQLPIDEVRSFTAAGFTQLQARTLQRRAALAGH